MKPLLIITGATATGKSDIAMLLAKKLKTDIISADSAQIYKGLCIGTAKPSAQQQEEVTHLLIDIISPLESFSSFEYTKLCEEAIVTCGQEGIPLIVGGTGFYIESLLYPLDFPKSDDEEYRKELWDFFQKFGEKALHDKLYDLDHAAAQRIHQNNVVRVIRALEILKSGYKISEYTRQRQARYPYMLFQIDLPREVLYKKINDRVDNMFANGLAEEVKQLYEKYEDDKLQSLQAIGYKEIIEHLNGKCTLEQAKENIKQNTRNYAKRQLTFFKRLKPVVIEGGDKNNAAERILEIYSNNCQN